MRTSPDTFAEVRVHRYRIPLASSPPGLETSHRRGVLLEVRTAGGRRGWGEAAPLPGFSGESVSRVARELGTLCETMVGRPAPLAPERRAVPAPPNGVDDSLAPSSRWALDQAIWSLRAAALGLPPAALHGASPRPGVRVNRLIAEKTVADVRRAVRSAVQAGYRAVKLKVGRSRCARDVARVRAAAELLGPNRELRVDANRRFSEGDAERFLDATDSLPIAYLEEPVAAPDAFRRLAETYRTPLALDETTRTIDPEAVGATGASVLVLKPTLLGGITPTEAFLRQARRHHLGVVLTSSFESGVGHRALGWLVQLFRLEDRAHGLDTYRLLGADCLDPRLRLESGTLYGLTGRDPASAVRTDDLELVDSASAPA